MVRYIGTVKFFNEQKGFGFITPENGNSKDHFVHISALKKSGIETLMEGDKVSYALLPERGKETAQNLRIEN